MKLKAYARIFILLCLTVLGCVAVAAPAEASDCVSNCYFKYDDCMSDCHDWDVWCAGTCQRIRDMCMSTCKW